MLTDVSPHEARALCAEGDPAELLNRLDRSGTDVAVVRRLLGSREQSPSPAAGTRKVPLTDASGRTTEMAVYTPSGTDSRQMGALILLHGVGGNGPNLLPRFKDFARLLNVSILCPTAQPVLSRSNRLDLAGLFGNRFDSPSWDLSGPDFSTAALYWARTMLNAHPDRCMIAGTSMGAMATWNLAMRSWGSFCAAVPINGALSMWEAFGTDRRKRALLVNLLPLPLFVVHGAEDSQILPRFDRESVAQLRAAGHEDVHYAEVPGGQHALQSLNLLEGDSPLFREVVGWMAGQRRIGGAVTVNHRTLDDRHGRALWVGVRGTKSEAVAEVRAERLSKDAISVRVTGAREVRLHLRSDLFAPGRVDVNVNGVQHAVEFRPELSRLLESYRETGDPELLDEHVVVLPVPKQNEEPEGTR
ncbi:hypothetical protein [Streptacidiphilus melanogenes]|uniref:hypothetical protein n=1 Tax=Streptacidiphilus melanogenes TaxID=411235 RepID=UPI0005AA37F6|nr:hypothetical protein [Streptacidiphilus melanogenes]